MCFSASASFTASAVLMPLGLYSTHVAQKTGKRDYIPLALVPFFFGVQQFVEGLEWTAIDQGGVEPLSTLAGLGFLFFAYCFWMIWIPWSAWSISRSTDSKGLQQRLRWVAIVATVLGIAFYLPVLFNPPALQPAVHSNGRLLYDVSNLHSIIHNFVNTEPVGELAYWGFIVLPLIALSDKAVKLFGVLIFVSIFLTWLTYSATFNSVWCFYCAVLSIYVIWIVNRPALRAAAGR
ncbi:MAG: hypothetical protein O3C02_00710 [Cyanobacteria bacterium]|jgi:hypothetical protein|uniref:DUF6629 family protein n=1 Tax=Synechococcus sp. CB0205 TaxID=232363 RepID=UPI0002001831|nr:DUF6629 family protein [Synechococcus sp. CB0205]MDA0963567.1 hypothetical protein [Cyanobacteriota bacterium]